MKQLPYQLSALKDAHGPAPLAWSGGVEPPADFWDVMYNFFNRPYFGRLWIVQEVVLAQKVSVLCGEYLFDWCELMLIAEAISSDNEFASRGWTHFYALREINRNCTEINLVNLLREWRRIKFSPDPCHITVLSQSRQVTDMRDKVHGLLGLVGTEIHNLITVDVSKSVAEVYTTFSSGLYSSSEYPQIDLLQFGGVSNSSIQDLPSWCIDFSREPAAWPLDGQFEAGKSFHRDHVANLLVSYVQPVIEVTGWVADEIAQVVEHPKNERSPGELATGFLKIPMGEATRRWDEECLQLAKTALNIPDDVPEAYLRTITADSNLGAYTVAHYTEWKQSVYENWQALIKEGTWGHPESLQPNAFGSDVGEVCATRKFFTTISGRIGVGPMSMQPGDSICIPFESKIPFVMRKNPENGRYKLQGDAYCSGLMYGGTRKITKGPEVKKTRFGID